MRSQINYIMKLKFLLCFKAAFDGLTTTNNILGGFRGAGCKSATVLKRGPEEALALACRCNA
jgi:hypothetical protein